MMEILPSPQVPLVVRGKRVLPPFYLLYRSQTAMQES